MGCAQRPGAAFAGTWGDPGETGQPSLELRPISANGHGAVRGNDGCNQVVGDYTLAADGDRIELEIVARTRMHCADFNTWLLSATTATRTGDTLSLRAADGTDLGALARNGT